MIDIRKLRDEFDETAGQLARRGVDAERCAKARDLDAKRRELVGETEALKAKRNAASKEIGKIAKSGGDIAAALGIRTTFLGQGPLPQRPITPYLREMSKKGVTFDYQNTMPFTISGQLQAGRYELEGDISSQFITGLLLALPLLEGDSEIVLTSPLQSKPYADMTLDMMARYGVFATETETGYHIPGRQSYQAAYGGEDVTVEGDFSQAAFFYAANALGSDIDLQNIPEKSAQGDRKVVEILREMWYNKDSVYTIHAQDIPDLVPILTVAASFCGREVRITGAERLRIKESDRLESIAAAMGALGANIEIGDDGLIKIGRASCRERV